MNEYFMELIERAQYYEKFEFFREKEMSMEIEIDLEWTNIREKYCIYN
jgi:hypothetical protein